MAAPSDSPRPERFLADTDAAWPYLQEALRDMRYGQITVIVQDGFIVQIERTDKRRFLQAPK